VRIVPHPGFVVDLLRTLLDAVSDAYQPAALVFQAVLGEGLAAGVVPAGCVAAALVRAGLLGSVADLEPKRVASAGPIRQVRNACSSG
jgi:hypothetical protein